MQRIQIKEVKDKVGETVKLAGWVDVRRDHGKLIFIDLRDASGKIQVVIIPKALENGEEIKGIRSEWVLEIEGEVKKRPENLINKEIPLGDLEMEAKSVKILNEAKTPIFEINDNSYAVNEETRLQYRYLDLRKERMQKNLTLRHDVIKFIRDYISERGFAEIETPVLTKSTPEGARDYIVPSRLHQGKFYALPQSPQQYKQLLMVSGFEKYFQIARCFRDEDTRGDRQPEFTQLDLEMSFVGQEDVMTLNEALLIDLVKKTMPEKKIQQIPFPRISYKESMEKYGTDRPDLRENKEDKDLLAFCWVIDFPFFSAEGGSASGGEKTWTFTHNPFSAPQPQFMEDLMAGKNIENILAAQYDIAMNGLEIGGGSVRNHKPEALKKVFEILGYSPTEVEENFGHMLEAFSFGAPPHAGIAWGLDRLISLLRNEPSIREVIAFPKTGDGRELMMNSPSEVSQKQLKELGVEVKKEIK